MRNPFKAVMDIRRDEMPIALLMFTYFFLVITSFWVLKPIKVSLFFRYYDKTGFDLFSWHLQAEQAELLAKVLNMVVAYLAVVAFTLLSRRFRRQQLTYIFSSFSIACYFAFAFAGSNPGAITVWLFYLFGDLFNTLMVATFFAFLNDSVTSDSAKRLYGLIVFGGVAGGAFGSLIVRVKIEKLSMSSWLIICAGLALVIIGISIIVGRLVERNPEFKTIDKPNKTQSDTSTNPALEGARLVFRSRYLLAIVGIVGFYEIASQVLDFQFKASVRHYLDGPAIDKQFATVYTITNCTSMVVQIVLTSFIMTRLGVQTALMILPLMILTGSFAFLAVPTLWVGSLLNTVDNGFNYSINQSAKENLYVPTSRDEKYKAKAFIDMFVQRFAKALAVGVSLAITSIFTSSTSIRWLSLFTFVVLTIWIFAARYAGRKFREMTT